MTIHALSGLPRSGTTLLGNVLAQHPDVHVTGTSPLYDCLESIVGALSRSTEVQGELANIPGAYERYLTAMRGLIAGWYAEAGEPQVIDKSRGWLMQPHLLHQLDPASALIVCVRDPRDVIASIERQHRATAAFHHPFGRTVEESTAALMGPTGNVGGAMRFIEDLIKRKVPATFVRYESFAVSPEPTLAKIHEAIGVEPHDHDLANIVNVATDLDALHRGKFPHDGSGALKPSEHDWREVLSDEIGARIAVSYPLYMQTFGYEENPR